MGRYVKSSAGGPRPVPPFSFQTVAPAILRRMRKPLALTAALIVALGSVAAAPAASLWEIGPIVRARNYSRGMPRRPEPTRTGWAFDFPAARAGEVHYVTFDPGSLSGKSRITMRYRVDAAPGVRFVPAERPDEAAMLSLVFQRAGDNWSARGPFEFYRWYSPPASVQPIRPGVHELTVLLDDPAWISVLGRPPATAPAAHAAALAEASRLGLVFGWAGGRGHGVYATGPARFTLLDFEVE